MTWGFLYRGGKRIKLREVMPEFLEETSWFNRTVTKEDLIGEKPSIVHFWSVSCVLCTEIMPEFNRLQSKYRKVVNVVSIHMPRTKEDMELQAVQASIQKYGMEQPVFADQSLKLTKQYGNLFVPAYYLFDRYGKLRHVQAGGGGMALLENRIKRLLSERQR